MYLVSITLLGAATVVMSLMERFQRSEWRSTRAGLYVCLGLCGVVPLVHIMALHGDVWTVRNFVAADALMGLCYIVSGGGGGRVQSTRRRWGVGFRDGFVQLPGQGAALHGSAQCGQA